jgi:peptidoglycan/xylan/chitin deacetylase (PgdA/CDA1 family)
MVWFFGGILAVLLWTLIYPVTDYWQRWVSGKVIKKGGANGGPDEKPVIFLTFDDGPNSEITPQILNVLEDYHIPATFFLVGYRAEASPELVKRILDCGHEIGVHTYDHCHAYGMFVHKSITTVKRGIRILEQITGKSIVWFRPPWGALNFFELLAAKHFNLKIVLWTANAIDWDIRTTPLQIVERLKKKLQPGCIIVIHDAGGDPGAPEHTLKALPEFIRQAQTEGYRFELLRNL